MIKLVKNDIEYYTFKIFNEANIIHGFPTKKGGYSKEQFTSLNFTITTKDEPENVRKNYRKLFETFNVKKYVKGKQTHSKNVAIATNENIDYEFPNNDGFVSKDDLTLITAHADCGSVFLYDTKKDVHGMLHSGWRGTASNITGEAIKKMKDDFGCNPKDIIIGIGPSICHKCFEVDKDVAEVFFDLKHNDNITWDKEKNKYFIDLKKILKKQSLKCGIPEQNIELAQECTMCNKEDFYSHRRDGANRGGHVGFIKRRRG